MEKKIRELDATLSEEKNASLKGSRQDHILFPKFVSEKMYDLERVLLEKYEIRGKGKVLGIAIINLLQEIGESKGLNKSSNDKKNGKKS